METKVKLKEDGLWSRLVRQSNFEFVSPYNIEECIMRLNYLKANPKRSSFFDAFEFKVENINDNGGVVNFKLNSLLRKMIIEVAVIGQLNYRDGNKTLVKLQLGYKLGSIIGLFALLALMAFFALVMADTIAELILTILFIDTILLAIQLTTASGQKKSLIHAIYNALTLPEQPLTT